MELLFYCLYKLITTIRLTSSSLKSVCGSPHSEPDMDSEWPQTPLRTDKVLRGESRWITWVASATWWRILGGGLKAKVWFVVWIEGRHLAQGKRVIHQRLKLKLWNYCPNETAPVCLRQRHDANVMQPETCFQTRGRSEIQSRRRWTLPWQRQAEMHQLSKTLS